MYLEEKFYLFVEQKGISNYISFLKENDPAPEINTGESSDASA
jgi:hypothetical protein